MGFGEAGNFRVSGLYSLLHPISPKWLVQDCSRNVAQATAGAVAGGKRRPAKANKSAHWRNRALAPTSNPGAHELLRSLWKRERVSGFVFRVSRLWLKMLRRRSQRHRMPWSRFAAIRNFFFPKVRILHPQPLHRFDARTRGRSPVR
jgi:hypothetical protein